MTDKEKRYWAYFLNVNGKIEYYEQCKKCVRSCKQSFRITKLFCKKYQEATSREAYHRKWWYAFFFGYILPLVPLNIITMEDELAILQEEFNEFAANSGSRVVGVSYTRKWKNR